MFPWVTGELVFKLRCEKSPQTNRQLWLWAAALLCTVVSMRMDCIWTVLCTCPHLASTHDSPALWVTKSHAPWMSVTRNETCLCFRWQTEAWGLQVCGFAFELTRRFSWVWWCMLVIPVRGGCNRRIERFRPSWATQGDPVLANKQTNHNKSKLSQAK